MPEINLRALRIAAQFEYERTNETSGGQMPRWDDRSSEFQELRISERCAFLLKYLEAADVERANG